MPDDFFNYRGYQVRVHQNQDGTFTAFYGPLDHAGQLAAEERATEAGRTPDLVINLARFAIEQEVR